MGEPYSGYPHPQIRAWVYVYVYVRISVTGYICMSVSGEQMYMTLYIFIFACICVHTYIPILLYICVSSYLHIYRIVFNPITTSCGHTFCRSCLCRSFDHTPQCPVCRSSLVEVCLCMYQLTLFLCENAPFHVCYNFILCRSLGCNCVVQW